MTSSAVPSLFRLSFLLFTLQVMNIGRIGAATRFYQFKVSATQNVNFLFKLESILNTVFISCMPISFSFLCIQISKQWSVVVSLIFLTGTNNKTHQAMPNKRDCNSQQEIPWPGDICSRR